MTSGKRDIRHTGTPGTPGKPPMMPPSGNPWPKGAKILWVLLKYAIFLAICIFAAHYLVKPLNIEHAALRWPVVVALAIVLEFLGCLILGRLVDFSEHDDASSD